MVFVVVAAAAFVDDEAPKPNVGLLSVEAAALLDPAAPNENVGLEVEEELAVVVFGSSLSPD